MPENISRKDELLQQLEAKSQSFSMKATLLSNALIEAEHFLQQLPAKVEVTISTDREGLSLDFSKGRNNWYLYILSYEDDGSSRYGLVTESNLDLKTVAARFLPSLYEQLRDYYETREADLDEGLASLRYLPFSDLDKLAKSSDFSDFDGTNQEDMPDDEIPF